MNRFTRRSALVLAVVLLLAGATTSFAQYTPVPAGAMNFTARLNAGQATTNPVRIAGMAEWVYDLVLTQGTGTPIVPVAVAATTLTGVAGSAVTMTFQISYSANISNKVLNYTPTTAACGAGVAFPAGTITLPPATQSNLGIQVIIANIACGNGTKSNTQIGWSAVGSTLNILFTTTSTDAANLPVPTVVFGTLTAATTITVKGVRLNVSSLGATPSITALTASFNAYPATNLIVNDPSPATQNVATSILPGLSGASKISGNTDSNFYFITTPGSKVNSGFGTCNAAAGDVCGTNLAIRPKSSYGQCDIVGLPGGGAAGGSVVITGDGKINTGGLNAFGGNGGANALGIKVTEGAPGILSTKAAEVCKSATGCAPALVNSEVDAGTRIRIDFSGLPSQVVVMGAEQVAATENDNAAQPASGLTVDLVGANYCTAGLSCIQANQAVGDIRAASGGTVTFEYEVSANTGATSGNLSSVIIPFWLYRTSTPVDSPSTINISVRLSPLLGGSVVRFSDAAQTAYTTTVAVDPCTTDIFYPWLLNTSGFDTGIWILNGSDQAGDCSAKFTETTADGVKTKTTKTPILKSKQGFAFTVSDSTYGNPGMGNGFARITCNFQGGHGAAYVSIGYGVGSTLTQQIGAAPIGTAYLALQGTETSGRSNR